MRMRDLLGMSSISGQRSVKNVELISQRADGVLRMLEGTTAEQQHVFNIQQQDLLGLYQPSDDDLTNTSMMSLSNILNRPV
ncbi:unnamed protein product [Rhizophagus irregularis]|nr:unnamed protein product [Rhizophagus irregularis]